MVASQIYKPLQLPELLYPSQFTSLTVYAQTLRFIITCIYFVYVTKTSVCVLLHQFIIFSSYVFMMFYVDQQS